LLIDVRLIGFSLTSLIPVAFLSVSHFCGLLVDFRTIGFSLTSLIPVAFLSDVSHSVGYSLTVGLLASLSFTYYQWRFSLSLTPVGYSIYDSMSFGYWLLSHFLAPSGVSFRLSLLWVTL